MSNVSINIRGRDEGLANQLDSLREKAKSLGVELNSVTSQWDAAQGVQSKKDVVTNSVSSVRDANADKIRKEYEELRKLNQGDFDIDKVQHSRGQISNSEFNKRRKNFQESQKALNERESEELKQLDKDSNLQLKLIYRLLLERDKRNREAAQNDDKEFLGAGLIGGLKNDIKELERRKSGATTPEEIASLNREIDEKKRQLADANRGVSGGGNDSGNTEGLRKFIGAAGAAGSGDLVGAASGAVGLIGGAGAAIGAGILAAIVGFMFNGEKVQENLQQAGAMRGFGMTGANTNRYFADKLTDQWDEIGKLGKSPDEIASMMGDKALASKVGGQNLIRRTLDDFTFQKGFGADAGIFNQFERFNKGQKESTEIALDALNTLVSIRESSLKEGDLVTLGEKLQSTQTIMALQRQKTDTSDSTAALRLLAGFESVGLSNKGEKAGDFLSRTINGLGEGGGDDLMMLKYQMMGEVNPELLNDPAAMQRALKYGNTDSKYIEHSLKRIYQMSGGNMMNYQNMIYGMFGEDLSQQDLNMYMAVGQGKGNFNAPIGGRKMGLDKDQMTTDAQASVGQMTQMMNQFQGMMQGMYVAVQKIANWIPGNSGDTIPVEVKDKNGKIQKYRVENPKIENDKYSGGVANNF